MQRVEITRVRQHLAHARRRPDLDIGADPAQPLDLGVDSHRRCRSSRRAASREPDRLRACRFPRSRAAHSRGRVPTAPTAAWFDRARCARPCCRSFRENPAARSRYCARTPPRPAGWPPAPPPTSRAAPPRAPPSSPQARRRSRRHRRRDRNSGAGVPGLPPGSPRTSSPPCSRLRSSVPIVAVAAALQRPRRAC